jgi:prepilin-type N-terminal cleavage/methylation domain-containing protein
MLKRDGFTLLEILLVMALLTMIAGFSVGVYDNYGRNLGLNATAQNIIYDLRQTRSFAAGGVDRRNWGIHLVNGTQDYYEIFSTPTNYSDPSKVITSSEYLPAAIYFSKPTEGNDLDIIFSSISGNTTADSLSLTAQGNTKTINITVSGAVY